MLTLILILLVGLLGYALYKDVTWEKVAAFFASVLAAGAAGDWSGLMQLIGGLF